MQAEGREEAAVLRAFEAMQLAERNEVEERELLQALRVFLNSGIINMPPAAEEAARRNLAGTPRDSTFVWVLLSFG